jgi:hypothetical protein
MAVLPSPSPVPPLLAPVPDSRSDAVLGVEELGSRIVGLAGRVAAATCRWLLLVAAFDARDGCAHFGLGTTSRWLMHYCGLSRRTAIEHVRVARALAAHSPLSAAMNAGRLSYSHVRAISRVADLGEPELVDDLIGAAENGTIGQLETLVRGLRTVDKNLTGGPQSDPEYLKQQWRADSRWGLAARLDPEHGALVQSALEAIATREGLTRAQALTRMAEIALVVSNTATGELPGLRSDELAAIQIQIDAASVPSGQSDQPEVRSAEHRPADSPPRPEHRADRTHGRRPYGRIAGGPGLPDAVIKRLLCSGRIRTVLLDGERRPLDLGRSHRVVTAKLFRALLLRDGGCHHPGCESRHGLEAHHVRHWIHGGATAPDNLVLLCRRHHHAHHDGEFSVSADGRQRFTFRRADGRELPRHVDPPRLVATADPVEAEHDDVEAAAATTSWDGRPMDRDYAVAVLAQRLRPAPRESTGLRVGAQVDYEDWSRPAA